MFIVFTYDPGFVWAKGDPVVVMSGEEIIVTGKPMESIRDFCHD
jgi:ribosomal protein L13